MTDTFVIECPACGKNNTATYAENAGQCKRCQADLTELIRIRNAVARSWIQATAHLAAGELKQAQSIVKSIVKLTPLPDDDPLLWLLKSIDIELFQSRIKLINHHEQSNKPTR